MEPGAGGMLGSTMAAASRYPIVAHQTDGRRSRLSRVLAAPLVVAITRARLRVIAIVIGARCAARHPPRGRRPSPGRHRTMV
jgi:hypothetical protein